jgi:hypothetical protein
MDGFDPYSGFACVPLEDQRVCAKCGESYTARPADETPLCGGCLDSAVVCDECDEPIVGKVIENRDPIFGKLFESYHPDCADTAGERAAEREMSDYHGGSLGSADYAQAHRLEQVRRETR